jgi:hypothetical protein
MSCEPTDVHRTLRFPRSLEAFPTGSRVIRVYANPGDYAYGRMGKVCREWFADGEQQGVLWDGTNVVVCYPRDWPQFEAADEHW